MGEAVLVRRSGRVLVVTINRPEVRNAVDRVTSEALAEAMDLLDADGDLTVGILTGAGDTFCSGMDLKAFLRGERPEVQDRGFAGVTEAPPAKPLVAAVEGWALAGGCELALACDLIVASREARFGLPEVRRGLIAGSGGLVRLPTILPRPIAMEYALTGEAMTAPEAHRWGLVNRVTEPGRALEEAMTLASAVAANAPLAVRMTKRLVHEAPAWPPDERWSRQRAALEEILRSADAREGAAAFAEKRSPTWLGR